MHVSYTEFCPNHAVNVESRGGNVFAPRSMHFTHKIFLNLTVVWFIFVDMCNELYQNQIKSAENMGTFSLTPFLKTYLLLPWSPSLYLSVWTVALNIFLLYSFSSLATVCRFLIPIIFKSSSTSSVHFSCGLPPFLVPSILAVIFCWHSFFIHFLSMSIPS